MEIIGLVVMSLIVLVTLNMLGVFGSIVELFAVATRESTAYSREHKVSVAKRYENMATDVDVVKVNETIAKIDALDFD